jgi:paraquat-inducible protein B
MDENKDMAVAQAEIKQSSNSWFIWLLPLIALAVGAWLVAKSIKEAPLEIYITFDDVVDITPLETKLKFRGTEMGQVVEVNISDDLVGMTAKIEMDQRLAPILQPDTVFWLVEPQVSVTQVTGLETILSGKFITFQLGEEVGALGRDKIKSLKPKQFEYTALSEPPLRPSYAGGLHLVLDATQSGTVSRGAPVYYKKIQIGEVARNRIAEDDKIKIDLYIEEEHKHLINTNSKFWNTSGISVEGSLSNIEVNIESLTSVLIGGISVATSTNGEESQPVEPHAHFTLYDNKTAALSRSKLIKISFDSGQGLQVKTPIKYQGVEIGEVEKVELQPNLVGVVVTARLMETATKMAREGTTFWVVKPEIGLASTQNIDTLISGRYINLQLGEGKPKRIFKGLEQPPLIETPISKGLKIVLTAPHVGSIKPDVRISYRQFEVGKVEGLELSDDATQVLIYATIDPEFAPLVRSNSVFWNASGVDVDFGLFKGASIKTDSLESILEGGIAFATPDNEVMGDKVKNGTRFVLNSSMQEEWADWRPAIKLNRK